jgi:hypothetical protein
MEMMASVLNEMFSRHEDVVKSFVDPNGNVNNVHDNSNSARQGSNDNNQVLNNNHVSPIGPGGGLWAEFGVASGRSMAFIANNLHRKFGDQITLHGFDSFIGIPEKWNKLEVSTFSMEGKIPEILDPLTNIEIHKGWFNATKFDLDHESNQHFSLVV